MSKKYRRRSNPDELAIIYEDLQLKWTRARKECADKSEQQQEAYFIKLCFDASIPFNVMVDFILLNWRERPMQGIFQTIKEVQDFYKLLEEGT